MWLQTVCYAGLVPTILLLFSCSDNNMQKQKSCSSSSMYTVFLSMQIEEENQGRSGNEATVMSYTIIKFHAQILQGFAEALQHCTRPQSSVCSLYGRHWALNLPYKEVTELWGLMWCCKDSAKPCKNQIKYYN